MAEAIPDPKTGPPRDLGNLEKSPKPERVPVESFVDEVTIVKAPE